MDINKDKSLKIKDIRYEKGFYDEILENEAHKELKMQVICTLMRQSMNDITGLFLDTNSFVIKAE